MKLPKTSLIREFVSPFFAAMIGVGFAVILELILGSQLQISKIESLINVTLQYFITMLAFNITAFTVTQLLTTKEWFETINKTESFSTLIDLFYLSILFHMFFLFLSFILVYLTSIIHTDHYNLITRCLFGMLFFSIWILKKVVKITFELMKT